MCDLAACRYTLELTGVSVTARWSAGQGGVPPAEPVLRDTFLEAYPLPN